MTLTTQWATVLLMAGSGFLIGTILDLYRVLKVRLHLVGWVVSLVDFVYWVVSAGLVFSLLFWSNWGDFRFYIFIAIVIGFISYLHWCSSKVRVTLGWFIQGVEKTVHYLYRCMYHAIWVPGVRIWRLLQRIGAVAITMTKNIVTFLLRPFVWALQPLHRAIVIHAKKHLSWTQRLKKWWIKRNTKDE